MQRPASRLMRVKGGAIDTCLAGLLAAPLVLIVLRRLQSVEDHESLRRMLERPAAMTLSQAAVPIGRAVAQQLGSPGQRAVGLRTVDARSGRRIALWRTLLVGAIEVGSGVLSRRLLRAQLRRAGGLAGALAVTLALRRLRAALTRRLASPLVVLTRSPR